MATAADATEPRTSLATESPPSRDRLRFTVEDYHRLAGLGFLHEDSRVELIDGDLVPMCPIGPLHADGVDRFAAVFFARFAGRAIVRVQNPVRLDERSEPQPDLMLLRMRDGRYASAHPGPADVLLLVEVMDSSAPFDRGPKLGLYARAGIAEVWLVDLKGGLVEVHRAPAEGGYTRSSSCSRGLSIAPAAFPDVELAVADLLGPA